jgi:hypothetical protein
LTINGREVEQVKYFTYLGIIITIVGGVLEDVCRHNKEVNGLSCSCAQFEGIKIS